VQRLGGTVAIGSGLAESGVSFSIDIPRESF
jgi:hypothetical protein